MDNLIGYSPSAPYEPPETSDFVIDTDVVSVDEALNQLTNFILA
jgi:adenylylsulfate kinase-like enzyme